MGCTSFMHTALGRMHSPDSATPVVWSGAWPRTHTCLCTWLFASLVGGTAGSSCPAGVGGSAGAAGAVAAWPWFTLLHAVCVRNDKGRLIISCTWQRNKAHTPHHISRMSVSGACQAQQGLRGLPWASGLDHHHWVALGHWVAVMCLCVTRSTPRVPTTIPLPHPVTACRHP
jgi:hypothetical protein